MPGSAEGQSPCCVCPQYRRACSRAPRCRPEGGLVTGTESPAVAFPARAAHLDGGSLGSIRRDLWPQPYAEITAPIIVRRSCERQTSGQAITEKFVAIGTAVLVFHDQPLNDCEPTALTKSLGNIELNAANNVTRLDQRRLGIEMHDISNLDQHGNMLARDDRRRVQSRQPAMRAAHEALDPQTKSEIEDLVAEHSL